MKPISIGVLGFGFLGEMLHKQCPLNNTSWATVTHANSQSPGKQESPNYIPFDWLQSSTWENLPHSSAPVVLTIPPVHQDRNREKARLNQWCRWMNEHRPEINSIIYISSTGVYPEANGLWTEEIPFTPDTKKGFLRLDTEQVLTEYFDTKVIRSGAIYGPGRHIGLRVLEGRPIPNGQQPVPRIHVTDLARIVHMAISGQDFPSIVNAVDLDSAPSKTVVSWLFQQGFSQFPQQQPIKVKDGFHSRKGQKITENRIISNARLCHKVQFKFTYPTYKEGLTAIANP